MGSLLIDSALLEKYGIVPRTEAGSGGNGLSLDPKKVINVHGHDRFGDTILDGVCGCGCIGNCEFPELYNWESDFDDDGSPHGGDGGFVYPIVREVSQHSIAAQGAGVDGDNVALYSTDCDYQAADEGQEDDGGVEVASDDNQHYHYGNLSIVK
ncbi:hypothetical protein MMYC01_200085 [Madurella mycetomatis]|uniref:Uncharacterized protein n=1 Tax=Madurella mycetomatis TaxID=100816 RepID=A0A150ASB4_9PEZI|nr:hypothetical protein MMYC01_200085 [Madurella mycetomatis]